mmetsp:Transcript_23339/g.55223  ORF Transcript_23339/g.55223 Transcript_23339/m.55223 type:complete len:163 (-) Transcript_23339:1756-2244(-)
MSPYIRERSLRADRGVCARGGKDGWWMKMRTKRPKRNDPIPSGSKECSCIPRKTRFARVGLAIGRSVGVSRRKSEISNDDNRAKERARASIVASLAAPALDLVAIHQGDFQQRQAAANLGGHAPRELVSVEFEVDQRREPHEFKGDRPRQEIAAEIELVQAR